MPNFPVIAGVLFELEKHFHVQALARRCAGTLLLVSVAGACAPVALSDGERRVALRQTTEQVILPTYAELAQRSRELSSLLEELESAPAQADLDTIRQAYLDTRPALEQAEAFAFGPAAEQRATVALDQTPIDTAKVEAELASDAELSVAHLRALGANKRGLHAIEYLLFPADDEELSAALLADDTIGQRRRQFASGAASIVADKADQLYQAWAPEFGNYAGRFSQPGAPDSVQSNVQAGLDTLLNQAVVLSEVVANVKLGKPLGLDTGGKVDVTAQESERAGASLTDIRANLHGIRNVYLGTRDGSSATSLSSLVHAKSPSADADARAALAEVEAALASIPEPLTLALREAPETVTDAYEATKALKRVLATEVLGTLGASLKFSDNDGD